MLSDSLRKRCDGYQTGQKGFEIVTYGRKNNEKRQKQRKNNRAYIKLSCDTWAQRFRMWFEKKAYVESDEID